jgi:hypothetical protein
MPSKPIDWLFKDGKAETYGHRPELRYNLLPYVLLKSDPSWNWSSCPFGMEQHTVCFVCRFLDQEGELRLTQSRIQKVSDSIFAHRTSIVHDCRC